MANASSSNVSGSQVPGSTNVSGGTGDNMDPLPALADDITTINANTAKALPKGTGTKTSWGRIYGKGAGGQTAGGY